MYGFGFKKMIPFSKDDNHLLNILNNRKVA